MKYKTNNKNWGKDKSWETTVDEMSVLSPYIRMNIYVCILSQRRTASDLDMHLAGAAT